MTNKFTPSSRKHARTISASGLPSSFAEGLFAQALALHRTGRLAEAETIYREILALRPDHPDSLQMLGTIFLQRGNYPEALHQIDLALKGNPRHVVALNIRGVALHALGRYEEALASYNRALTLRKDYAEAQLNRGNTLKELKRPEEALESYDRALTLRPDYAEALCNRGTILNTMKRYEEALASHDRALRVRPDWSEALFNRGLCLFELRRFEEALSCYDRAVTTRPDYAQALSNRGIALFELKRFAEALASCDRALSLRPALAEAHLGRGLALYGLERYDEALASHDRALTLRKDYPEAHANRALALHELRRYEEALASYGRALALRPDYAEVLLNRGNTLKELSRLDDALASFDHAIAVRPDYLFAHNNRGNLLKALGRLEEAQKSYVEALRINPRMGSVYANLADCKVFTPRDPHLLAMEALATTADGMSKTDRMQIDFALGKAYADLKDYPRSFEHLLAGNAAKRASISYDENADFAWFDRIEAVFTRELIEAKTGGGDPSTEPIFVLGMPRSGTTLVEQIIASHPTVHGAGELRAFSDAALTIAGPQGKMIPYPEFVPALNASDLSQIGTRYLAAVRERVPSLNAGTNRETDKATERVTDKMPSNYSFVGLMHLALPNAKILNIIRDPLDTCVSCFSTLFSAELNFAYDLGELGRYYKRYEQLMAHWHRVLPAGSILDVRYEDVVADLEGQARRIMSYLGLPWDDRCLAFHQTDRPVNTASATQVRRPIYASAVGRWRVYEPCLAPLLNALDVRSR